MLPSNKWPSLTKHTNEELNAEIWTLLDPAKNNTFQTQLNGKTPTMNCSQCLCYLPITVWDVKLDGLELFLEVEDTINPQTNTVQILWCWEFILIGLDKLNIQSFKFKLIGLSSPIQILVHCLQLGLHFCFYILPNVHSGT